MRWTDCSDQLQIEQLVEYAELCSRTLQERETVVHNASVGELLNLRSDLTNLYATFDALKKESKDDPFVSSCLVALGNEIRSIDKAIELRSMPDQKLKQFIAANEPQLEKLQRALQTSRKEQGECAERYFRIKVAGARKTLHDVKVTGNHCVTSYGAVRQKHVIKR